MQRSRHLALIAIVMWIPSIAARTETLRVPEDRETIQDAIDASRDGDTVLVGAGEYVISAPVYFRGKAITVRSGDGPERTVIRMDGTPTDPELGSVIVFFASEKETSVLEGFTITGGQGVRWGTEPTAQRGGGGVYCEFEVAPRIVDCRITGNSSQQGAGVLGVFGASPTFVRCEISANTAELGGAGGAFYGGSPAFSECEVSDNIADSTDAGQGGGLFFFEGAPTVADCVIRDNLAQGPQSIGGGLVLAATTGEITRTTITRNVCTGGFANGGGAGVLQGATTTFKDCEISANFAGIGGGLDCYFQAAPVLENCRIVGNIGVHAFGGGGLRCWGAAPALRGCIVAGNSAEWGGGIQCFEATPTIINSVIAANFARSGGGGVQFTAGSDGIIRSSTIVANATIAEAGGGVHCGDSSPQVIDSIVWGNTPPSICGQVTSCLTDADPLFVDPGEFRFDRLKEIEIGGVARQLPDFIVRPGDYRLREGSPAIDGATSDAAPLTDILGNGRCGRGADIGAYEHLSDECGRNLFQRGEIELNGSVDITDAIAILEFLFSGGGDPPCLKAADVSDDGVVNITDPLVLFDVLFQGESPPAEPFAECGYDPTPDDLTCETATCEVDA